MATAREQRRRWTEEDNAKLRSLAGTKASPAIAKELGKTTASLMLFAVTAPKGCVHDQGYAVQDCVNFQHIILTHSSFGRVFLVGCKIFVRAAAAYDRSGRR